MDLCFACLVILLQGQILNFICNDYKYITNTMRFGACASHTLHSKTNSWITQPLIVHKEKIIAWGRPTEFKGNPVWLIKSLYDGMQTFKIKESLEVSDYPSQERIK